MMPSLKILPPHKHPNLQGIEKGEFSRKLDLLSKKDAISEEPWWPTGSPSLAGQDQQTNQLKYLLYPV